MQWSTASTTTSATRTIGSWPTSTGAISPPWPCSGPRVARELFPGEDPLDQIITLGTSHPFRVVGVLRRASAPCGRRPPRQRCVTFPWRSCRRLFGKTVVQRKAGTWRAEAIVVERGAADAARRGASTRGCGDGPEPAGALPHQPGLGSQGRNRPLSDPARAARGESQENQLCRIYKTPKRHDLILREVDCRPMGVCLRCLCGAAGQFVHLRPREHWQS